MVAVNRLQWQQLAERWLIDAKRLLDDHRWSAAYYLAGYAVECGLKACVLVRVAATPEVIFETKRFSENCWTHDLDDLIRLAGLRTTINLDIGANRQLGINWIYVTQWKEVSRYQTATPFDAQRLYQAVTDAADGVLPWIRARW